MPNPFPNYSFLHITPLSGSMALILPPFAVRALSQTLEPIQGSGVLTRRDINGSMVNLTNPQFRKYRTKVSFRDVDAPSMNDAWIGQVVQMDCACEFNFLSGGSPARPVVPGSMRTEGHFTYYRPSLVMMIKSINHVFQEWQAEYATDLEAEEV